MPVLGSVAKVMPGAVALPAAAADTVPASPFGSVKLRIAAVGVPLLLTAAAAPGAPVVTVPTWMVPAAPGIA